MANCLLKVGVSAGIFALGIISTRSFFTTRAQLITNDEHYATMKARKNELRKKMKKRLGDVPLDSIAEQSELFFSSFFSFLPCVLCFHLSF